MNLSHQETANQLANAERAIVELQRQKSGLQYSNDQLQIDKANLEARMRQQDEELNELRAENVSLVGKLSRTEGELHGAEIKKEELQKDLDEANSNAQGYADQVKAIQGSYKILQEQHAKLTAQYNNQHTELVETERKYDGLLVQFEELKKQVNAAEQKAASEYHKRQTANASWKQKYDAVRDELQETKDQVIRLVNDLSQKNSECIDLKAELQAPSRLKRDNHNLREENRKLRDQLAVRNQQLETAEGKSEDAQKALAELQEASEIGTFQDEIHRLRTLLTEKNEKIHRFEANLREQNKTIVQQGHKINSLQEYKDSIEAKDHLVLQQKNMIQSLKENMKEQVRMKEAAQRGRRLDQQANQHLRKELEKQVYLNSALMEDAMAWHNHKQNQLSIVPENNSNQGENS